MRIFLSAALAIAIVDSSTSDIDKKKKKVADEYKTMVDKAVSGATAEFEKLHLNGDKALIAAVKGFLVAKAAVEVLPKYTIDGSDIKSYTVEAFQLDARRNLALTLDHCGILEAKDTIFSENITKSSEDHMKYFDDIVKKVITEKSDEFEDES
jgi:hypothetical protein